MCKKLVIIGAGGHGRVVADIAKLNNYTSISFLDDAPGAVECSGYPVVGQVKDAVQYPDCEFAVAIGNAAVRREKQELVASLGGRPATLIHPGAVIADDVVIGAGTVIMAGAVVNPGAVIGKGCIVNTCASVDHDCVLADWVHIAVGAHLAGAVTVGEGTWIGVGAVVSNHVSITGGCMIGAGAVVVGDLNESGTYIGVPARKKAEE